MALDELLHLTDPAALGAAPGAGGPESYSGQGIGLAGPFILRPWDDPLGPSPASFYGMQAASSQPFQGAPSNLPAGGLLYFDAAAAADAAALAELLNLMQVYDHMTDYAALLQSAAQPAAEGYLHMLRLVDRDSLKHLLGLDSKPEGLPEQEISARKALAAFVAEERAHWGEAPSWGALGLVDPDPEPDLGLLGEPRLGFGVMVENGYRGIYRIWSRLWFEPRPAAADG